MASIWLSVRPANWSLTSEPVFPSIRRGIFLELSASLATVAGALNAAT